MTVLEKLFGPQMRATSSKDDASFAKRAKYRTSEAYAEVNALSERLGLGRPCEIGMATQAFLDAVAAAGRAANAALEKQQLS